MWNKKKKFLVIYPGTFNPLHAGHLAIAQWAEDYYDQEVLFDVSVNSYDKAYSETTLCRESQFKDLQRKTYTTNQKTFIGKETFIRGKETNWFEDLYIYFLVGVDTILRIDDPKYYFGSSEERDRVISLYSEFTRFVVFPRGDQNLNNIPLSLALLIKCIEPKGFVPVNISSTEIREGKIA